MTFQTEEKNTQREEENANLQGWPIGHCEETLCLGI